MAWSKVGETESAAVVTGSGSENVNLPGTPASGDIVCVTIGSSAASHPTISTSGYNQIGSNLGDGGSGNAILSLWYKKLTGADTQLTIAHSTDSAYAVCVTVWRGSSATTILDGTVQTDTGATGQPNPPAFTTVANGSLRWIAGVLDDDRIEGTITAPSGYGDLVAEQSSTAAGGLGQTTMHAFKVEATGGTNDDPAAFGGGDDTWAAMHIALRIADVGGGAYEVDADAGSYAITGTAATLKLGRKVAAAAGSYTTTGSAATLKRAFLLSASAGSYAVSGTDAAVSITAKVVAAGAGSYAVTGSAAGLSITAKVLEASAGSYAVTGADASLERALVTAAGAGSYATTGADAALERGRVTAADAGSYAVTGTDAGLSVTARVVAAESGAYSVTGTDAGLSVTARVLAAEAGAYAVTGTDASLVYEPAGQTTLVADAGSYEVTGTDAGLIIARRVSADAGTYEITGTDAELAVGAARTLDAEPGSYLIAGTAAELIFSQVGENSGIHRLKQFRQRKWEEPGLRPRDERPFLQPEYWAESKELAEVKASVTTAPPGLDLVALDNDLMMFIAGDL